LSAADICISLSRLDFGDYCGTLQQLRRQLHAAGARFSVLYIPIRGQ